MEMPAGEIIVLCSARLCCRPSGVPFPIGGPVHKVTT
jgi:hypothetical protein